MQNKKAILVRRHGWDVSTAQALKIQEQLRKRWIGEDCFAEIRTVAGLDVSFVLVESQATRRKRPELNRWTALRGDYRAIGCVVMYCYPQMEEIERSSAVLPLSFPYVPGFLSFREIPVLLAALAKLKSIRICYSAMVKGMRIRSEWAWPRTWGSHSIVPRLVAQRAD